MLVTAHPGASPLWPPAGAALAALLLGGTQLWPGVFLGALAASLGGGLPVHGASLVAAGATLEAVAGVSLLRRVAGFQPSLDRLIDVVGLSAASLVTPVIAATLGTGALLLQGGLAIPLDRLWLTWWSGDCFGILLLTPLALVWSRPDGIPPRGWRLVELVVAGIALTLVASEIYFFNRSWPSLVYPFVMWPALRAGLRGGTLAALLVAVVAAWGTVSGSGPLPASGAGLAILNLQVVVGVTVVMALVLGAVTAERERARAEALRSGESLRALLEAAPVGILTVGMDNRVSQWNAAAERIFGYSAAEVIGRPIPHVPAERWEEYEQIRAAGLRGEPVVGLETTRSNRNGEPVHVRLSLALTRDGKGRPTGAIKVVENITDRRRSERALTEQHLRLQAILDGALDAVITADESGTIIGWDGQASAVFGWSSAEALGRNLTETIIPPEFREAHRRGMAHYHQTGVARVMGRRIETSAQHRDGRVFPVELAITQTTMGQRPVFSAFVRDLTGRKEAEDALEKTEAHLQQAQKMEAIGRLAGGVAHDFNNLLTSILGHTEVVLEELRDADPLRGDIVEIRLAAERAARLTGQLLAFSRKQVIQPRALDLSAAVEGIAGMLRRLIGEPIQLATRFPPALDPVLADPGQVEQVIVNLVVNARDAMPNGGTVTVETGNVELDEGFVTAHPGAGAGPHVMLAVHDNGTGMPPEVQAMIFEPFFTTKELHRGTGLGLATVYGIVKQSGGYIGVESAVGRGTSMRVYLPRASQPAPPASAAMATKPSAGSGTILLVEDEDSVRGLTRRILTRAGYHVLAAGDGREALKLAQDFARPIDLLLTDVVMGGLSGPRLAEALRPIRPEMAVLFMSGYSQDTISSHGVLGEGVELLRKPFTPATLTARVLQVLRARWSPTPTSS